MFHIFIIILLTQLLFACFLYEEKIYDNPYDPDRNAGLISIPYHSIIIDADTSDWSAVRMTAIDSIGDIPVSGMSMITGGDLTEFKIAQDDDNVYFYIAVDQGYPLQTPGTHFHINCNENINSDIKENYNLIGMARHTDGSFGFWNELDGYSSPSPNIRFAGVNQNSNTMEIGVAKSVYWDLMYNNYEADMGIDTWYEDYQTVYGDGYLDGIINDNENNLVILFKDINGPIPAAYAPIMNFPWGSPAAIDGNMDAGENWESSFWYQDITGDDSGTQDNCDIDRVYVMQDEDRVYFFITFSDLNPYTLATSYEIQIDQGGAYWHSFYSEHDGAAWSTVHVNYNASQYINGSSAAGSGLGAGIEMEFEKHPAWGDISLESAYFRLVVRDQSSNEVDTAVFLGSYKAEGDPAPFVF